MAIIQSDMILRRYYVRKIGIINSLTRRDRLWNLATIVIPPGEVFLMLDFITNFTQFGSNSWTNYFKTNF